MSNLYGFVHYEQLALAAKAVLLHKMGKTVVSKKDVINAWESIGLTYDILDELETVRRRLKSRMEERRAALQNFPWLGSVGIIRRPRQRLRTEKKIPFVLLRPGRWDIDDVIAHYKREAANFPEEMRGRTIDWKRLRKIKKRLNPTECFIRKETWLGYVVFTFRNTRSVVLKCPFEGNYILRDNWKAMARSSKRFVRANYRRNYTKVVYKNDWIERVSIIYRSIDH
jgi:hypothetical protein